MSALEAGAEDRHQPRTVGTPVKGGRQNVVAADQLQMGVQRRLRSEGAEQRERKERSMCWQLRAEHSSFIMRSVLSQGLRVGRG